MHQVSFPGLGIEPMELNPVAFTIPIGENGISIRWYALIIVSGMILAFLYCYYRSRLEGVSFDDLLDITLFTIIFSILGARLYYVLTTLHLGLYKNLLDVFAIWEGGLAIYGGIIAGAATIIAVCRFKKFSARKIIGFLDAVAPALMIGQLIGRWGNFVNGEAYGGVISETSPLYFLRMGIYPHNIEGVSGMAFVHPTFLYESLWNLLGFALIHFIYKKKKFTGQFLLTYLAWYGFGRMLIEGLRTDSLYVGVFRISQVLGFLCFVVASVLLIVAFCRVYRKKKDGEDYTPSFANITGIRSPKGAVTDDGDPSSNDNTEEDKNG